MTCIPLVKRGRVVGSVSLAGPIKRIRRARRAPVQSESAIQADIVAALRKTGRIVHRLHCGRVRVKGGGMHNNEAGTPDLLVVAGQYLETKTPENELSDDQVAMHRRLRNRGCKVHTVRSVAEALRVVMKPEGP